MYTDDTITDFTGDISFDRLTKDDVLRRFVDDLMVLCGYHIIARKFVVFLLLFCRFCICYHRQLLIIMLLPSQMSYFVYSSGKAIDIIRMSN